jgi:hypothetical protein
VEDLGARACNLTAAMPERVWVRDLFETHVTAVGLSLRVAFRSSLDDVVDGCDRLRSRVVTPLCVFVTETTEPSVIGWLAGGGGVLVQHRQILQYLRDSDGHLQRFRRDEVCGT